MAEDARWGMRSRCSLGRPHCPLRAAIRGEDVRRFLRPAGTLHWYLHGRRRANAYSIREGVCEMGLDDSLRDWTTA